eukprot:jgi/Ulvmu1/4428/UM002_0153.1
MERIFRQVLVGVYSLDASTDLPPSIIAPGSMLARAPFFVVAQSLNKEMQEFQRLATEARAHAVDRDELQLGLDQANLEHAKVQKDLDEATCNFSKRVRTLQLQLEDSQRELGAAREELESVKHEKGAEILRLEGEVRQLEKDLMIASNADASNLAQSENRLLHRINTHKHSQVPQGSSACMQQGQQAAKLQHQLLDLLAIHILERNSAHHELSSKQELMEEVMKTFEFEVDTIHEELQMLPTAVPAHAAQQDAPTHEFAMCLPNEADLQASLGRAMHSQLARGCGSDTLKACSNHMVCLVGSAVIQALVFCDSRRQPGLLGWTIVALMFWQRLPETKDREWDMEF